MGRASNSFTGWVGHAPETANEDHVTLPEKDLWIAVLYGLQSYAELF